jgi:hypothetical protein
MAHRVHQALRTGSAINLGTFGPTAKEAGRPDPEGFMRQDALSPGGMVQNVADSDRVMQQRNADMLAGRPSRSPFGPLPDASWDAFFGALQRKESNAADNNMHFNPQLAGHGPGEGIGHPGFRAPGSGMTVHPLDGLGAFPSVQGLQSAADRFNRRY